MSGSKQGGNLTARRQLQREENVIPVITTRSFGQMKQSFLHLVEIEMLVGHGEDGIEYFDSIDCHKVFVFMHTLQ